MLHNKLLGGLIVAVYENELYILLNNEAREMDLRQI